MIPEYLRNEFDNGYKCFDCKSIYGSITCDDCMWCSYGNKVFDRYVSRTEELEKIEQRLKDINKFIRGTAYWIKKPVNVGSPSTAFFCSNCNFSFSDFKTPYCPYCGRIMIERKENENT